jgi:hypothetical protein
MNVPVVVDPVQAGSERVDALIDGFERVVRQQPHNSGLQIDGDGIASTVECGIRG